MKQGVYLTILLIHLFRFPGAGQAGFKKGYIITTNDYRIEGFIKQSFKTKGVLIVLQPHGKTSTYSPSQVKCFAVDSTRYIAYANDFYEEIYSGDRATLYKKITNNGDAKIYNGSEMVGFVTATQGKAGDFYVLLNAAAKLDLVTKRNFKSYFLQLLNAGHKDSLASKIRTGDLQYDHIRVVIELYNK